MVDQWNKEIDTMLVFVGVVFHRRCNLDFRTDRSGMHQAGLFSAILTAFNVQSYILLTPDPDPDPILLLHSFLRWYHCSFMITHAVFYAL